MTLARRLIGLFRKVVQLPKEFFGLADKQAIGREGLDNHLRAKNTWRDRDRANDRNDRQFPVKDGHGSGMIRLVWKSSRPNGGGAGKGGTLRFGNVRLPNVSGARGVETPLPALSDQVWKCMVSVGPMLSRIRNTTGSVTFKASVG
jgi:hypothetical protein